MRPNKKGIDKKWLALVALVIQNSGQSIVMRYTLVSGEASSRYMTSTAVLMSEIIKLLISLLACFLFDSSANALKFKNVIITDAGLEGDWLKLCVPSVLYTVQNSLQYAAMAELSAPVFQVMYQMKIITTALFSVILLKRYISAFQWGSIVALTLGVATVQLSQQNLLAENEASSSFMGLVYVICGCSTSGFAGVYFEMVLKSSKASIWVRNIQLAVIGICVASVGCIYRDGSRISSDGFFRGYDYLVWGVIAIQAVGGLIVAVVVKYADNVIKNFATSFSIILSVIASAVLFDDVSVNTSFVGGSATVLGAVYWFGSHTPVKVVSQQDIMREDTNDESPLKTNVV
jgi:UDP-sugar transporter A1/2/3